MIEEMLIKGAVEPVDIERTEKILHQMRDCICKIKINGVNGTGFFCKIPFGDDDTKNFLMTNYHILDKKYFEENAKLKLILYNDQVLSINLNLKRKTYFDKDYDISLIELNDNDNINNDHFLELDNNLFNEDSEALYEDISIYALHFPNGDKASVSYGLMIKINNFEIKHKCSTEKGSSGSPILNLKTNKVIGIHKGFSNISQEFKFNLGTFLKFPLNDFIENELNKENKSDEEENDIDITYYNPNATYVLGNSIKYAGIPYVNPSYFQENAIYSNPNAYPYNETKAIYIMPKKIEKEENNSNKNENDKMEKKINVIFKDSYGNQTTLSLKLDTTIDEMLKIYLIRVNKIELIGSKNKPHFFYNSVELHFGDDCLIQDYFKMSNIIFITVV